MTATYWGQWDRAEIMSMQGIELGTYQDDDHDDSHLDKNDDEQQSEHCCSLCMECLGLSWRDFM
jgi:hypothetical protein